MGRVATGLGVVAGVLLAALASTGPAAGQATALTGSSSGVPWARTTCYPGHGVVTMTMTPVDEQTTRLTVVARDVPNGRWHGGFAVADESGRPVRTRAVHHAFETTFTVAQAPLPAGTLVLQHKKNHFCAVAVAHEPARTYVGGAGLSMVVRHARPGELTVRGFLPGCRNGSVWRTAVHARLTGAAVGGGAGGLECKRHRVHVPAMTMTYDSDDEQPHAVRLVLRSAGGAVRRAGYRLAAPPAA